MNKKKGHKEGTLRGIKKIPGVFTKSEPHQTIPNLVVKRFRSDNTERGAFWEDSLMPGNLITKLRNKIGKTQKASFFYIRIRYTKKGYSV